MRKRNSAVDRERSRGSNINRATEHVAGSAHRVALHFDFFRGNLAARDVNRTAERRTVFIAGDNGAVAANLILFFVRERERSRGKNRAARRAATRTVGAVAVGINGDSSVVVNRRLARKFLLRSGSEENRAAARERRSRCRRCRQRIRIVVRKIQNALEALLSAVGVNRTALRDHRSYGIFAKCRKNPRKRCFRRAGKIRRAALRRSRERRCAIFGKFKNFLRRAERQRSRVLENCAALRERVRLRVRICRVGRKFHFARSRKSQRAAGDVERAAASDRHNAFALRFVPVEPGKFHQVARETRVGESRLRHIGNRRDRAALRRRSRINFILRKAERSQPGAVDFPAVQQKRAARCGRLRRFAVLGVSEPVGLDGVT